MIIRKGCKDVWNSYFVIDADYENDIPCCPNTGSIPEKIITWEEAVTIYNKNIKSKHYFEFWFWTIW